MLPFVSGQLVGDPNNPGGDPNNPGGDPNQPGGEGDRCGRDNPCPENFVCCNDSETNLDSCRAGSDCSGNGN